MSGEGISGDEDDDVFFNLPIKFCTSTEPLLTGEGVGDQITGVGESDPDACCGGALANDDFDGENMRVLLFAGRL